MTHAELTCLVCDRVVDPAETDRYTLAYFSDVCICRDCLVGERDGYPKNVGEVRAELARRRLGQ